MNEPSILDRNPEIATVSLPAAKEVAPDLPLGMGTALHHLISRVEKDRADQFFQQVIDEIPGTPGAILHAALREMAAGGGRRVQAAVLAISIRAWNAFFEGRDITRLRYSPERERFPVIAGLEADEELGEEEEAQEVTALPEQDISEEELVAEYTFVTPELAVELLKRNDRNRLIADAVVAKYKRDMIAGNWLLNGQTIKIGLSGRLLDGQHRCRAAQESGVGFPAIIVRNVDDSAFDTVDLGAKRRFNNILSERGEKSTGTLAAALKLIWLYEEGKIFDRAASPTNAELDDVIRRHPNIRQSVKLANKVRQVIAPALGVTIHYLFSRKDPVAADGFLERLCDGQNLNDAMPVWHLRDRLLKDRASRKVKILEGERFALAVKAWNAVREGRSITALSWRRRGPSRENFPQII